MMYPLLQNFTAQDQKMVPDAHVHNIKIQRKINILSDASALFDLYLFFMRNGFSATLSVTPKAGFITSLAAFMAGVPVRFHWFTGQIWVSRVGFKRSFFKISRLGCGVSMYRGACRWLFAA